MRTTTTLLMMILVMACSSPARNQQKPAGKDFIRPGAWSMNEYLPLLKDKKTGLVVNHTSKIDDTHLLDTLRSLGISIPTVFTPEHGLKGTADAGEHVKSEQKDSFQVISLFGQKRKPDPEDLDGLDIIVFDIQDVGVRFYTYISTMHYMMEAAARKGIPFIVLDRPNPNGKYVDGPVLKEKYRSFVGVHPIPTVHGLTVGELAKMINGEGWLANGLSVDLTVIPVENWTHSDPYKLPIKPSPNLPNSQSIRLYPSLCLFEGTMMSVGRGTIAPFQQVGHPDYPDQNYAFTPVSMQGAKSPKYENQKCFGINYQQSSVEGFDISPLIDIYHTMGEPEDFFNDYFKLLSGDLDVEIKEGLSEAEIRASWQKDISAFKRIRKKYLLYPE